jgi:hypothetical protein
MGTPAEVLLAVGGIRTLLTHLGGASTIVLTATLGERRE